MAKGSLFWGKGRGKLGEAVLSVTKGQQISRAYNAKPGNPKTYAQMNQRVKLANSVKFYRQMTAGLFKFAFEDKRPLESDYNAFMRHSVNGAVLVDKMTADNNLYPAVGNFAVSAGSLGGVNFIWNDSLGHFDLAISTIPDPEEEEAPATWGEVSTAILAQYPSLAAGDIVTFGRLASDAAVGHVPSPFIVPTLDLFQLVIDPTSDVVLNSMDGKPEWLNNVYAGDSVITFANPTYAGGAFVIVSRIVDGQPLKVTNSFYAENDKSAALHAQFTTDVILRSWGASEEAILQGALLRQ